MKYTHSALKHLFLQQSYLDAWEEYERQLASQKALVWDYVILTASNEAQAEIYRQQIHYRLENGALPRRTCFHVLADPDGRRVGSGGATLNVLAWLAGEAKPEEGEVFRGKRILVIHSGGDSKRVPQYSVCGKLFAPVPRELPNGMSSTLFDEFMVTSSMVPGRIQEGMLVLSGDVLLLFNALQIDGQFHGAAAISMKEEAAVGVNHGVFLSDGKDMVKAFLHKQTEENLRRAGAVNGQGKVDLDTGAILLDPDMLASLYSLICREGKLDQDRYRRFINEKARISFYGDFLYPLAASSALEDYLQEEAEGKLCPELLDCRREIWDALQGYQIRLLCLSPAEFVHFGTTGELQSLMAGSLDDYAFLGWKNLVCTNALEKKIPGDILHHVTCYNTFFEKEASIGEGSYLEHCCLYGNTEVGRRCVLSGVTLQDVVVPDDVVMHGLKLQGGKFVVRTYAAQDNPKATGRDAVFLTASLEGFVEKNGLSDSDLWGDTERCLWFANLYPVCSSMPEAVRSALALQRMARGEASPGEIEAWRSAERKSLYSSFNEADGQAILPWQDKLKNRIIVDQFVSRMSRKEDVTEAFSLFCGGMNEKQYHMLLERGRHADFSEKIRIYYALAKMMEKGGTFQPAESSEDLMAMCFGAVSDAIWNSVQDRVRPLSESAIKRDFVEVCLPVRINWGGWLDGYASLLPGAWRCSAQCGYQTAGRVSYQGDAQKDRAHGDRI